ncbi:capsular biosynthesis protein, partial [Campylobacter sp. W0066.2]|nr:capsular biosynthesis protein [Campylobacter sp. W0066.2]
YNLDNFIQLSVASCFMNITFLDNLIFDEKIKPNFEDAKFINEYLLDNINSKSAFLPKAKYFYRKREDSSSTLDLKLKSKDYYLNVTRNGYLKILSDCVKKRNTPLFIQNLVLYDIFWQIEPL